MLKKIVLAAMLASSFLALPQAASAGPGNCDCEFVIDRNSDGDAIGGHWECPDPAICQITVEP